MATRHYCDICRSEIKSRPLDFGADPMHILWGSWHLEITAVVSDDERGLVCRKCLKQALADHMIELLCNSLGDLGDNDINDT